MAATNQISTSPYLLSDANQATYNYGQLPPDQALEEQALNRRQHIANLLIQQGLANPNHGQMVGRFYVAGSPVQGLSDLAKVAAGAYGTHRNDQARQALTAKSNEILARAVEDYKNRTSDVPAVAGPQASAPSEAPTAQLERLLGPGADQSNLPQTMPNAVNFGMGEGPAVHPMTGASLAQTDIPPIPSGEGRPLPPSEPREQVAQALAQQPMQGPISPGTPARPRTPEERQQALVDLMASQHPQAAHLGQLLQGMQEKQQAHEEDLAVRREGIAANTELRKGQIEAGMQNTQAMIEGRRLAGQDTHELQAQLAKQNADLQKTLHQMDIEGRKDVAKIGAENKGDFKEKANYNAGLKEVAKDDAMATQADQLEASLNRWDELNKTVPTGRIVGQRPAVGQPDFQELVRLESQLAMNNFKPGQGQISNFERQLVKGAGPNTLNDPEANANIVKVMKGGVQNMREKAAFKEWYLETNGKLLGADQKWNEYVEQNPRYLPGKAGAIVENPNRQGWMEHFSGGEQKAAAPSKGPAATPQAGGLTPAEQQELDMLKKKYGR